MKKNIFIVTLLCTGILLSGCASWNNAAKGTAAGAGAGVGIGAAIGALIGKDGKSTAIGAAIGTAVGTTAGAIIGKQMDKAAAEAAAIEGAKVDSFTDANDLKALRVTFDSGILFEFNKSTLNEASKKSLTNFSKVLKDNPTMDIMVFGHTDNTGTLEANQKISEDRAQAVARFLRSNGVPARQIVEIAGRNFSDPVASNETSAGRAQNRRVEVYMYAGENMIKEAQQQAR
ncbi:OmpA family protein [Paludibacter sp. 221]|uniref:OmpA family protein n=1 Tax=Paludibacter sp. 221 TaxID=2302939 RepID=UPI0013D05DAE|nr:OmpA family protein [Paludibacter sp. 221]NDV47174.1 OmpA family protein [Paludibacter sp. 221]